MTLTQPTTARDQANTTPATETAEELIRAVALGDERAFARLYDRLVAAVHGTVRAVVADLERAADLTEEVFVELWRTAGTYHQDSERGTGGGVLRWAMTIAYRRAAGAAGGVGTTTADPMFARREQELRALNDDERESLLLAQQRGVTYRDIAAIREVAAETVLNQLHNGLHRLRSRFTAHPETRRDGHARPGTVNGAGAPAIGTPAIGTLAVHAYQRGGAEVLVVSGEVDLATAPQLWEEIERCLTAQPPILTLNLNGVSFFGAIGLATLLQARVAAEPNTHVKIVASQRAVLRPIHMTGLDQELSVFATVEHALGNSTVPSPAHGRATCS